MKQTKIIMGMPITVEIVDAAASEDDWQKIFGYFEQVEERFSVYKDTSEISRINRGEIKKFDWSEEMKIVFALAEETKIETDGYFDIMTPSGKYDPSGLVKGWAIQNAARQLLDKGFKNFYIEAGGDIQVAGKNSNGDNWRIGIRNPFNIKEVIKVISVENEGVATSGTYIRGQHIYDPKKKNNPITEIVSLTVVGPDVYQADRFATAAFAMRERGIAFIERLPGFEGYVIDNKGLATLTSGFAKFIKNDV
jgi:FAD:protein FMN transferase